MSAPGYGEDLSIAARFRGPNRSGNGGYTAGSLAARVRSGPGSVVEVTLRQPPPLEVAMKVQYVDRDDGARQALLLMGGSRIAEAHAADTDLAPVEKVSDDTAKEAATRFPGFDRHPFPSCFVCGPERLDDGLRIFPGQVGPGRTAATWVPRADLAEASDDGQPAHVGLGTAWAALDCISGWAGDIGERLMVLGRMTAAVDALPLVGEPHVVVGAARGRQGRKTFTASTLYDSDGRIAGRAEHVWVAIDPSAFS